MLERDRGCQLRSIRLAARALIPSAVLNALGRQAEEAPLPTVEVIFPPSFSSADIGSYAQWGEDLAIDAILGCPQDGFYVDVGANEPTELNNTKRFSLRGWAGINVEPDPATYSRLVEDRRRDVNLNVGIAGTPGTLEFYRFEPNFLSTFDHPTALSQLEISPGSKLVEVMQIPVMTLKSVLDEHLPPETRIDFFSVDVEGSDLEVLESNDWVRYRPRLVMVELTRSGQLIQDYLDSVGYSYVWCNGLNGLFADKKWLDSASLHTGAG